MPCLDLFQKHWHPTRCGWTKELASEHLPTFRSQAELRMRPSVAHIAAFFCSSALHLDLHVALGPRLTMGPPLLLSGTTVTFSPGRAAGSGLPSPVWLLMPPVPPVPSSYSFPAGPSVKACWQSAEQSVLARHLSLQV